MWFFKSSVKKRKEKREYRNDVSSSTTLQLTLNEALLCVSEGADPSSVVDAMLAAAALVASEEGMPFEDFIASLDDTKSLAARLRKEGWK